MTSTRPHVAVATITIKAHDAPRLARFWRDLLGYVVAPNHSDSARLEDPVGSGPTILIQPTRQRANTGDPDPVERIHLDLRPDDQHRAVARAIELGARPADIGQAGDEGWVVLADPEGNLFCILQSASDHADLLARDPGTPTPIDDL
ncbi:MAG TPA: VOC family protein [Dermatophilaceae bacterium]|nr:VOC family protein [Dermatophilaceae bacterium]HMT88080.1 VOC family protein [Dermatophilaceae bacterium]